MILFHVWKVFHAAPVQLPVLINYAKHYMRWDIDRLSMTFFLTAYISPD